MKEETTGTSEPKQVSKYEEAELCKVLPEISLLDSAYQRSIVNGDDILLNTAKRYRVDVQETPEGPARGVCERTRQKHEGYGKAEEPKNDDIC